jgi:tRNA-modifying protein YgfZ
VAFDVELTGAEVRALHEGRHAVPVDAVTFRLQGPGAISCLQGMVTNDVEKAGSDGLIWSAFLTPKGMIISDCWIRRDGAAAWVIVPSEGAEAIRTLFTKTIPPRLAKVTDVSSDLTLRLLLGAAGPIPDTLVVGEPTGTAPFRALVLATQSPDEVDALLEDAGWHAAPPVWRIASRLLTGWPKLGREIDEKTLPQEVRFDELGGVKYDKGCYTGQETVARLHFRGHANRVLRGLRWDDDAVPVGDEVHTPERQIGTIRTIGRFGHALIALAVLRREAAVGEVVLAGGAPATVIELPEWGVELRAG